VDNVQGERGRGGEGIGLTRMKPGDRMVLTTVMGERCVDARTKTCGEGVGVGNAHLKDGRCDFLHL